MDLQLKGRRCLVTGASAGIGAKIVEILAQEGALVVATARRVDRLDALADSVEVAGWNRPAAVPGDITDKQELVRIAREAADAIGPIEILMNCAGNSHLVTAEDGDEPWDVAYGLNFKAVRRMTAEVLPSMRKAGWGRIINFTALMEPMRLSASMAAKAAVHNWAKALSREIAIDGVTINAIAPGRIETEQVLNRLYPTEESRKEFAKRHIPAGHFGKPADPANLAAFLASPLAGYITGTVIPVDGGMKYT